MTVFMVCIAIAQVSALIAAILARRRARSALRENAQLRSRLANAEKGRDQAHRALAKSRHETDDLQFALDDAKREMVLYRDRADTITMPAMKAPPERKK